ncbi:hypothetical protein BN1356_01446 [Streptococcus varani]|uniref:Transposase n=1 Tax=Streptococcus varani TaxID=1608583 RepID=A0A0E4H4A7_9STRE|nr:hypothetical protein [Streptococcus varani]CQR25105.1 hypothetical protein BN1356_01446 [Streptococcus varani]
MKIITQLNLFEDHEMGDLEKILTVLDGLPETNLFQCLEERRRHGRRDYSVQSYFIAYVSKFILQLETDQQLIRHLNMNRDFRFENHTIRGLKKMRLAISMSFLVMIGFALAKLKTGNQAHLASWVV